MPSTPTTTQGLEKLVRLCLVFSSSRTHLRLLDAILRADAEQVRGHLEDDISSTRAADSYIYPMILQLVIDHGHPVVLEEFARCGNTAATMGHSLLPMARSRNSPISPVVGDVCAWRLSTNRCIELVDHGLLNMKSDTFEQLLMLSDPDGFDRLLDIVFHPPCQPDMIADAAVVFSPWKAALAETAVVGSWMSSWRLPPGSADIMPLMHPIIQDQAREITRRWSQCVEALLDKNYPSSDPATRLQWMLSSPERIRIDLGLSDFDRVQMASGIIAQAMEQAGATPGVLPQSAMPDRRSIDKYDWMHALMLCGFNQGDFPRDPLSELLNDAGTTLKLQGNRTRFTDGFISLYSRIVSDHIQAGSSRPAALPGPFAVDVDLTFPCFAAQSINASISSLSVERAVALGEGLMMHASTTPARAASSPSRRM